MADEITSIWKLDHDTIIKLQEKIGTKADGMIGENTIKKLQAWINKETNAGLVEDGKLGPKTIKALQEMVGVEADGSFGPATANALKVKLLENAQGEKEITDAGGLDDVVEKFMREQGIQQA
ncbi:MAG: hypothetical protein J6Z01_11445 [Bacteroidales bacterium]|nr:hypothetical protein [Bacteroidales bacterium]